MRWFLFLFLAGFVPAQTTPGQYEKAIEPLQKALDQEKKESKLSNAEWRHLVESLAIAYRGAGKLTAAEEVLQYGISKDSKCATFYYTLGAIYGDWNKVYVSIKWLKQALENQSNGEKLPDPRQEDTFERFMKNDDFRAVLREFDQRR